MPRFWALLPRLLVVVASAAATHAQAQERELRLGMLSVAPVPYVADFRRGMAELGYVEGRNYRIEYRESDGARQNVNALAAELVALNVDCIVTGGSSAVAALRAATATVPIVSVSGDPVQRGFARSLARPEGNITGVAVLSSQLNVKRVEFLKEALPSARVFFVLTDAVAAQEDTRALQAAGAALGVRMVIVAVRGEEEEEIRRAFDTAKHERAEAFMLTSSPLFANWSDLILKLAAEHRLPAAYESKRYAEGGGLLTYGPDLAAVFHRMASYVDRIAKGAKPGELAIEQPAKFEFVVNLKAAKALGVTVPPSILLRADHVIE